MPTAGEARLKSKSVKKTSKDGVSLKGKAISNKNSDVKRKVVSQSTCSLGKSSIPVPVNKGVKGKENADPNVGPPGKINKKSTKVRKAPDFSKLHKKWEDKLSKGKAVSKKKNTAVEAFNLTKDNEQTHKVKRPYAYNSEDEEQDAVSDDDDVDFEIDSTALKGILSDTGIKDEDLRITGRTTIATIPSSKSGMPGHTTAGILKRTSIYYTGPTTQHAPGAPRTIARSCCTPTTSQVAVSPLKPRNIESVPPRPQAGSWLKKQVAWADQAAQESDVFDFQPDFNSLQSILNNTGISENQMRIENTGRVTLAGGRLTPHRRNRQVFREEPSKRTSIYYTGPKRTRPSPRGPVIGRTSVFSARQTTEGSVTSAQKNTTYNPLVTVIGRQGNLEQDQNDPVASLAARQFPTRTLASDSQPLGTNPLLTPARKLVSSAQPSSVRAQPSWADIFTPQRGASLQESATQATHSQSSFEPLQIPGKQQPFEAEMCTPQREVTGIQNCGISQGPVHSTFANSSTASIRQPLVESKQQLRTCISTPKYPTSNTRQFATTQSQSLRTPSIQQWHPQASSQALRAEVVPNSSHVHVTSHQSSTTAVSTPSRQGLFVSQSVNSDQPQLWSEIFTPQRGPLILYSDTRQSSAVQSMATRSFNDFQVTPFRQGMPLPQASCSRQQPPMSEIFTPQPGNATQNLGSRLQCSTVQVTSFQPSPETEISGSTAEARLPQHMPAVQKELFKSTSAKEEDDIAQLERQALEDLGLLHINEATQEETSATSCTSHDNADNDLLHSATSNFPRNVTRGEPSSRPLSTCSSNEPAVSTLDQHKSWYKVASTCPEEHSSFSPVVRFANPTPVKGSRSVSSVHNTLYNGFSKREGRGPRCSKDVSANSLSLRSAVSPTNPPSVVQRNTTVITEGSSRFRWETNGTDDFTSVFRPATCDFRRTTKALAQEALLDMEVSSYMVANHGHVVTAMECRPMNPLARVFLEGDAMRFKPINL